MKTLLLAFCLLALSVTAAHAADVSGTWNVDGDVYGHPVKFTCDLTQEGETLSGTAALETANVPVTGSVKDALVVFEYDTEAEGVLYHLVFTGKLDEAGVMRGTIAVAGVEGTFTATKQ